jgi:RNA ligase partner protein
LSAIQVKSPDTSQIQFSAGVFYQLVDEIRKRSYRGLNIAEETIEQAAAGFVGTQKTDKKDFQIKVGSYIKNFRDRYRNATRTGFLDSVADLDLIVLAKELDGTVVSTDEGVMEWGRLFGVHEIPPSSFLPRLSQLLASPHHQE